LGVFWVVCNVYDRSLLLRRDSPAVGVEVVEVFNCNSEFCG